MGRVEVIVVSPFVLRIIQLLPTKFVAALGRKILDGYLDKYGNINVSGMENIKDVKRPVLFICNHLSNSDGAILNRVLKDEDVTFVVGIKMSGTPLTNLGFFIAKTIAIRPNTADKEAVSNIVHTLKCGGNILVFPEGTRSRNGGMIEAKKGVVLFQRLTKVPIVPIGIYGSEKLLPINDKDMGAEKFQYADVGVNIGKPIYPEDLPKKTEDEDRHELEKRQTDFVMKRIAELLPEKYRGVYGNEK